VKIVDYFGPRIAKDKLAPDIIHDLHQMCLTSEIPYNHRLFGYIEEQKSIAKLLSNTETLNLISACVHKYLREIDSGVWKTIVEKNPSTPLMELAEAWYNKQVEKEFNPLHDHRHHADLVCVIYTKINTEKKSATEGNQEDETKPYGKLSFFYSYNEKNDFGKRQITITPAEGDLYIFPATLGHFTHPTFEKSERFSISCNFRFTEAAQRLLKESRAALENPK
jgi:hypothetical protein